MFEQKKVEFVENFFNSKGEKTVTIENGKYGDKEYQLQLTVVTDKSNFKQRK